MRIEINDSAEQDLREGRDFYEGREAGIGDYFVTCMASDLDSLRLFAGVHPAAFGFHRMLSKRFPFGIYYLIEDQIVRVYAILDLRRDPAWIRGQLGGRQP